MFGCTQEQKGSGQINAETKLPKIRNEDLRSTCAIPYKL